MHKSNIWVKLSRYIIVVAFYCYLFKVLEEDTEGLKLGPNRLQYLIFKHGKGASGRANIRLPSDL